MTATVTDMFCGAGGSSLGAEAAGMQLVMAANHWQTAIDVHQANFPDAAHDCADISEVDPRRWPVTDVLLASPECTNHSQARGVSRRWQDPTLFDKPDPSAERSRATMWSVPHFAEQNRYSAIVVENVVEATKWALWPAWWQAMELLGYSGRVVSLNAQDHGVAQSRDRILVVWVRTGLERRLDLEMERTAWCPRCERTATVRQAWKNGRTVGRYRQQWEWRCLTCSTVCQPDRVPAAAIIDWSLDCPRIGDRARPLAEKTRARIAAGLERFGWLEPVVTVGAGNGYETTPGNRARSTADPLATQTTTLQHALAEPPGFLMNTAHGGRISDLDAPHPTVCASDDRQSLVVPLRNHGNAYPTGQPLGAVTAGGFHHGLLMRNNQGGAEMVTPVTEPARTLTTSGHQSLLMPYYGQSLPHGVDRPVGTVTTRDRHALIDAGTAVDDCGFRMLEPFEVAAAQAFPAGYIPRDLSKKDQVKLAGNAVPPPMMTWATGRVLQALEAAA